MAPTPELWYISTSKDIYLAHNWKNRPFANERAKQFQHGTGMCSICRTEIETNKHLFLECGFAKITWYNTARIHNSHTNSNIVNETHSFYDLLDQCLARTSIDTTKLLTLYETLFAIWKTRNSQNFKQTPRDVSPLLTAHEALLHARAQLSNARGKTKIERLNEAAELLDKVIRSCT